MVTQFTPVPPGWVVRFALPDPSTIVLVYPLLGWLLTSDGPQPAVWHQGVVTADTMADMLAAENLVVEPAE